MTDTANRTTTGAQRKIWNHTPSLPLRNAPYWDWPMRPVQSMFYLLRSWKPVGMRFFILLSAVIVWTFCSIDLERAQTFSLDWMVEIWVRNFVILTGVAGGGGRICC